MELVPNLFAYNKMMKKHNLFVSTIISVLLLTACGSSSKNSESADQISTQPVNVEQEINSLSASEKADGWELLFDGTSTNGWHNYLQTTLEGWQVEDGILFTPGKQGDIVTDREFENFEISLDWKIEDQGNSGVFFHIVEDPKYKRIHETGPEFQIIDNENYPAELTESQKTGANSDVKAPTVAAANAPGSWNSTRISVNQGQVEHWLNGQKILEYDMDSPEWKQLVADSKFADMDYAKIRKGRIGLQDHGGPVYFRNIKIREH